MAEIFLHNNFIMLFITCSQAICVCTLSNDGQPAEIKNNKKTPADAMKLKIKNPAPKQVMGNFDDQFESCIFKSF